MKWGTRHSIDYLTVTIVALLVTVIVASLAVLLNEYINMGGVK